jgi:excisionase family DNA binding protein
MPRSTIIEARRANGPRRGLNREEAAVYVGVSPTKFDELVKDGTMPAPKKIGSRRIFDMRELDLIFGDLPVEGRANPDANDWD